MSYDLLRLSLCSSICSYQIIKKRYRCVCLYNDTFMPFGIEHLRRAIVSCSTSPPPLNNNPQTGFVLRVRTLVDGTVLRCLSSGWSVCPSYEPSHGSGGRRGDSSTEWVARPTNHLVPGFEHTPHKKLSRAFTGFDPRLVDEFGHTR